MRLHLPWRRDHLRTQTVATLAYPYYVDAGGLRGLADSLEIELPTVRERKRSRRASAKTQGLGAELGWEEGHQLEGHIHLNVLVTQLKGSSAFREIAYALGQIPPVHDRGILTAALAHVQNMPNDEESGPLEDRLRSAYETERAREIAVAKREELLQAATQNHLVILRGTFETVADERGGVCVSLTHLEPAEVVTESAETPDDPMPDGAAEMPMPEDVGIRAVLPASEAFTSTGRERLDRGAPFYGQLIGHSASFDETSGVLTCSAYAVWGLPRPVQLLDRPQPYDFLERR